MIVERDDSGITEITTRRGIYIKAFDIYRDIGGFYDYGPIGLRIKRNIESVWRSLFVDKLGAMEVETSIMLPEPVLKSSGHLDTFTDPLARCLNCGATFRADKLLEKFYEEKKDFASLASVKNMSKEEIEKAILENKIKCEKCGKELKHLEDFNLLFKTSIGPFTADSGFLRPETAQGIFLDFKALSKAYPIKLPAAVAQVGKVFRNEISPRQQLIRLREFSQMETELFFDPESDRFDMNEISIEEVIKKKVEFIDAGEPKGPRSATIGMLFEEKKVPSKQFATLVYLCAEMMDEIGLPKAAWSFREIEKAELPHYSRGNVDIEIQTSYGAVEVAGIADRTNFDLKSHSEGSKNDLSILSYGKKVLPHVVEASIGLDRLMFCLLDTLVVNDRARGWKWLRLNSNVAPYKYAVFPLQHDDELEKRAHEVEHMLKEMKVRSYYSDTGSIGKRYARADEIGVPYCITIDYDTLKDRTVTIRDRDTAEQKRVRIEEI